MESWPSSRSGFKATQSSRYFADRQLKRTSSRTTRSARSRSRSVQSARPLALLQQGRAGNSDAVLGAKPGWQRTQPSSSLTDIQQIVIDASSSPAAETSSANVEDSYGPATPSLLGIPRELRLMIIENLDASDLNCSTRPVLVHQKYWQGGRICVPWANLMLVCRELEADVRIVKGVRGYLEKEENVTYSFDLHYRTSWNLLVSVVWQRLPCAPHQVRFVKANITLPRDLVIMDPGGRGVEHMRLFLNVAGDVCRLVNLMLPYGPRRDSSRLLRQHMDIEELILHFRPEPRPESESTSIDTSAWWRLDRFRSRCLAEHINNTSIRHLTYPWVNGVRSIAPNFEFLEVAVRPLDTVPRSVPRPWSRQIFRYTRAKHQPRTGSREPHWPYLEYSKPRRANAKGNLEWSEHARAFYEFTFGGSPCFGRSSRARPA